jgi:hypothetical protein
MYTNRSVPKKRIIPHTNIRNMDDVPASNTCNYGASADAWGWVAESPAFLEGEEQRSVVEEKALSRLISGVQTNYAPRRRKKVAEL